MNRSSAHTQLVREIMASLGSLPGVVLGGNPTGLAHYMSEKLQRYAVHYGWPSWEGGPDILAAVAPLGRLVALEVKTGKGVAEPEQLIVHEALRHVGCIVAVVRSVEGARQAIDAARRPS